MDPISLTIIGSWLLSHLGAGAATIASYATIAGGAAVITAIGVLVAISYLTISAITSFFREKDYYATETNMAVSFKAELKSGRKVVVQGFFKKTTGMPVSDNAVRTIQYDSLSSDVEKLHRNEIVEWQ